jgi:hypothetical protein
MRVRSLFRIAVVGFYLAEVYLLGFLHVHGLRAGAEEAFLHRRSGSQQSHRVVDDKLCLFCQFAASVTSSVREPGFCLGRFADRGNRIAVPLPSFPNHWLTSAFLIRAPPI